MMAVTNFSEIEDLVNSEELEAFARDRNWDEIWAYIEARVSGHPKEFYERLERDLRDWWKNGNLYHWKEGETNAFGMTKWEFGDPDFWYAGDWRD